MLNRNLRGNLRAFRAAAYGLFIVFILTAPSFCFAQQIHVVDYQSQADVKVFVTQYRSQADLIVYKTTYRAQGVNNKGIWYFTNYASQSDKTIFFTKYESLADVKIHFTTYRTQAGWKNNRKKHFFY